MIKTALVDPTDEMVGAIQRFKDQYYPRGYQWSRAVQHWGIYIGGGDDSGIDLASDEKFRAENETLMDIWNIVKAHPMLENAGIHKTYVSAATYGCGDSIHVDSSPLATKYSPRVLGPTIVIYLNEEWHRDWAGETVIIDVDGSIVQSVIPSFGRTLIFPPYASHGPRPIAKSCDELRQVLVIKTQNNALVEQYKNK